MATKAIPGTAPRRSTPAGRWRQVARRSATRALEMGAALLLFGLALFLVLALASYHQTDPSASTAAGGEVLNWMGAPGAFVADQALFLFGPAAVLLVPLPIAWGRRLWRFAEAEESGEELGESARGGRPPGAGGTGPPCARANPAAASRTCRRCCPAPCRAPAAAS